MTENDIFGKELPLYPIERINTATGEPFEDGEHILYVNGAYRGNDELGALMHDFCCSDADDMINKDLAEKTRYFKETEEGVEAVCKVMEDMRRETADRTLLESIQNLMDTMKWTAEQAMNALKIPAKDQKRLVAML